jgi:multidrug efflux pump subunit AcrB
MTSPDISTRGTLAWMAGNSVVANLLMFIFLIGGLIAAWQIRQELFPYFIEDTVEISVAYPGASPEEVENGIILAVENALEDVEDIDSITSTASESSASIVVDLEEGSDVVRRWQEIKSAVTAISTFPDEAEEPVVAMHSHRRNVVTVALHGAVDELTLRTAADTVRDRLLQDSRITQVELNGIRDYEVQVEIPQDTLRRYGLTLSDAADAIAAASVELGGGSLKTGSGDILVRVKDRREFADQYARVPLMTNADGSQVLLGDVATVRDGFEETNSWAHFDGEASIMIVIDRVGDQTPEDVAEAGRAIIDELNQTLPQGLRLTVVNDRSVFFTQRAQLLVTNALQGLVLVFVFLALFMETRLAFWVCLGIPVSFLGSFLFLSSTDFTINMISMFAFIVTLGIVVDDAIVVGENVHHWRSKGLPPLKAAIAGVREVALPVLFSVLTNLVSFLPLLFIPGHMGKVFNVIPLVVTAVFSVSLIECLFILPSHLAYRQRTEPVWPLNHLENWQRGFNRRFEFFVRNRFGVLLRFMMGQRYAVLACGVALLLAVAGYVASGRMGLSMFPSSESEYAYCAATLPYGSAQSKLAAVEDQLVQSARNVIDDNGGANLAEGILSTVTDNQVEVRLYLAMGTNGTLSTSQVTDLWRSQTPDIPGLESLRFESNMGGPGSGKNLTVRLGHADSATLEKAGADLAAALSQYSIVHDIDDGSAQGKRQFDIRLLPLGERMGLTSEDVARQVRYAFQGAQAVKQQRGLNEVTVRVQLPAEERSSEYTLENLVLRSDQGEVYLRDAATLTPGRAYTEIERIDGRRSIEVTANVDPPAQAENILTEVRTKIVPELQRKYPGLTMGLGGHQEDMRESLSALATCSMLALFAIYALLVIPFRSFSLPLIIMVSIPFGIIGAVLGHVVMGYPLSVSSIFGMVALSGVVVNDSLVLMDFANRKVADGMTPFAAVHAAAIQRFRPIMLTTATTFGGLLPMITETSRQARMMIPMAISLGFGVLFSTLVIMVIVPSLYVVLDDIVRIMYRPTESEDSCVIAPAVHESAAS